jgi:hypothetical protein
MNGAGTAGIADDNRAYQTASVRSRRSRRFRRSRRSNLLRDQLTDALLERVRHLSDGFQVNQFDERVDT